MPLSFAQPLALLLLLPVIAVLLAWHLQETKVSRVLRAACLVLLVLALAELRLNWGRQVGTVVVLADRSASQTAEHLDRQQQVLRELASEKPAAEQLAVISFAEEVSLLSPPSTQALERFPLETRREGSNLADALEVAGRLLPKGAPARMLVLSDGRWTGRDPLGSLGPFLEQGLPIDTVVLDTAGSNDLAVHRLESPEQVRHNESFMLHAWTEVPLAGEYRYRFVRDGKLLHEGRRRLLPGTHRLSLTDVGTSGAVRRYRFEIQPTEPLDGDLPQNNAAETLVSTDGARPLLVVREGTRGRFAELLRAGGIEVDLRSPEECRWDLGFLGQYGAVVLENLDARNLSGTAMLTLSRWVQATGSGLMITGGEHSYGAGGYFGSPLEEILPVSLERKVDMRKQKLALVYALDRSGSMTAPVGKQTKMDLANSAVAQSIGMLNPLDMVGVLAVDTSSHVVSPLLPLSNTTALRERILAINSQGGGIYVEAALVDAFDMLREAEAGIKHLLLFADAADAEEPGEYVTLLKAAREAGITVSVVGLGNKSDPDADLLQEIAQLGGGQFYLTESAVDLPRFFLQDTILLARRTFEKSPATVSSNPHLYQILGSPLSFEQVIDGYNVCHPREGATVSATISASEDETPPLITSWMVGTGRVLAYTGEVDGKYTGPLGVWRDVGKLYGGMARWVLGEAGTLPESVYLQHRLANGMLEVEVELDPNRDSDPLLGEPTLDVLLGREGESPREQKLDLAWVSPDRLRVTLPVPAAETALAVLDLPGLGRHTLSPKVNTVSPEYLPATHGKGPDLLRTLASRTGGTVRLGGNGLWREMPTRWGWTPLRHWLVLLAAACFLAEVFNRRTGWLDGLASRAASKLPQPGSTPAPGQARQGRPAPSSSAPPTAQPTTPGAPASSPPPSPPAPDPDVGSALRAARKRAEQRLKKERPR